MAQSITLDQVETMAEQLSPQNQLKLLARVSETLSRSLPELPREADAQPERLRLAEALLAEVADVEDDSQGEFDAVETLRQVREQESACFGYGRRHL